MESSVNFGSGIKFVILFGKDEDEDKISYFCAGFSSVVFGS